MQLQKGVQQALQEGDSESPSQHMLAAHVCINRKEAPREHNPPTDSLVDARCSKVTCTHNQHPRQAHRHTHGMSTKVCQSLKVTSSAAPAAVTHALDPLPIPAASNTWCIVADYQGACCRGGYQHKAASCHLVPGPLPFSHNPLSLSPTTLASPAPPRCPTHPRWLLVSPEKPAKSPSGRRTHMPQEASLMLSMLRAVLLERTHM